MKRADDMQIAILTDRANRAEATARENQDDLGQENKTLKAKVQELELSKMKLEAKLEIM